MKSSAIKDKSPVSLTGHFTGYVWCNHYLSPTSFSSVLGRIMYYGSRPADWLTQKAIGVNLESMLLQRHCLIDELVNQAIEEGVTQIVEVASGLSARSLRTLTLYADNSLRYIEADLPDMVIWKKKRLKRAKFNDERFKIAECNILREEGVLSIEHLLSTLDKKQKTLIITEGLVNYFPLNVIESFWTRLAYALAPFDQAHYLFEIWPKVPDHPFAPVIFSTQKVIEFITRQEVPLHYTSDRQIKSALEGCGFSNATVINPDKEGITMPQAKVTRMTTPTLFRVVKAKA
ncbi:class I SAM-dependent methyltransferase [Alkalimarinus sediminis]|uniref:Class I SAM-dependent methyltransferase n=1 Tax=Alkalimarinus sediminis TaxID=1632866 RepID=A0A9E8HKX4_9ALTE|nr:class I SAM-dependent methyltransferase [Alkalimarinus sediminis]UZW75237.1 class I SAM-dependent methyltransferase [Alkalimarinus sediminis]